MTWTVSGHSSKRGLAMGDRVTSPFGGKRNGPPDSEVRTVGGPYRVRPPSEKDPTPGYHRMVEQVHDHPSPGKWRIDPGGRSVADGRPRRAVRIHGSSPCIWGARVQSDWRRSPEPKSSEPNVLLGPGLKTLDKVYRVGYTPTIDPE